MQNEDKKKILVVDDDENLRKVLLDKLEASGFDPIEAPNGQEGLDKALDLHPALILLDILMPVMDGWEMLGKLRKDEWGKHAKVLMLTGIEDAEAVAKAIQDGSFAYLIKTQQSMDSIVETVKNMTDIV